MQGRWSYLRVVFASVWHLMVATIFVVGLYDLGQGQGVVPDDWPKLSDALVISGNISWEIWAIIGLALVAAVLLEGGYRVRNGRQRGANTGKPDVVFEVRESIFRLSNYNHNRPKQPLDRAEVTLKGRLGNRADVKADIEGVRVALMERGWLWRWSVVSERPATMLLGPERDDIDLNYREVSADARSRSRGISEIWAYIPIPVSLKQSSKRAYRLRIFVDAFGQSHPSPMYESVDMPFAFRIGLAGPRYLGKSNESTQNREGSQRQ